MKRFIYLAAGIATIAAMFWFSLIPYATAQATTPEKVGAPDAPKDSRAEQYQRALDEQTERAKRYDELLRRQEDMSKRSEALLSTQERLMSKQEASFSRFEKILDTWERQQKQYQKYLDFLTKSSSRIHCLCCPTTNRDVDNVRLASRLAISLRTCGSDSCCFSRSQLA
jgi:hypothetical protein